MTDKHSDLQNVPDAMRTPHGKELAREAPSSKTESFKAAPRFHAPEISGQETIEGDDYVVLERHMVSIERNVEFALHIESARALRNWLNAVLPDLPVETTEHRDTARLRWLANTVLCSDYGDNPHPNKLIGWRVMEFVAPVIYGKTLEEAIDAGMADEFHRRRQRQVKPTIDGLEKLLQSEDTTLVQILPDGSVREITPEEPSERCVHNLIDCVSTLTVIDPYKAKCRVCLNFFDLPLDQKASEPAADHEHVWVRDNGANHWHCKVVLCCATKPYLPEKASEDPRMEQVRSYVGEWRRWGKSSKKILAIKLYREIHSCGLKEAVHACEAL